MLSCVLSQRRNTSDQGYECGLAETQPQPYSLKLPFSESPASQVPSHVSHALFSSWNLSVS